MKTQFGQEVLSLRVEKDSFFRSDMDSPIPSSDRSSFKGLNYFPPDEGYRVTSKLERFDSPKHITMATSTGTRQTYLRYGAFTFEIKEQSGDDYELDFNRAYNPYCAYSEDYTCPIPPVENRLPVKILAGEKNYK